MSHDGGRGVALGGFMGTGKSTVGRALALRLGLPFVDTDALLAERFGAIAAQFARDGEAAFRAREQAVLRTLCDGTPRVVATGGGLWVDPRNRALLRGAYRTVVLEASLDRLRERVADDGARPLWDGAAALLTERSAAYADADLRIDTDALTVDDVVERIVGWLEAR